MTSEQGKAREFWASPSVLKDRPFDYYVASEMPIHLIEYDAYLSEKERADKLQEELECHTGILQPCWDCQDNGYVVIKVNLLIKILVRFGLV